MVFFLHLITLITMAATAQKAWKRAATIIPFNTELNQVLVLMRGPTAEFMPNSYVFPGGTVDAHDFHFPLDKTNFDKHVGDEQIVSGDGKHPKRLTITLGLESDAPLRVCAIREMFEESGLLPVVNENCRQKFILSVTDDPHLAEWRKKILNEPSLFKKLFSKNQKMDVDSLVSWSNWLTPFKEFAYRYNTAFYLLPMDESPRSTHCIHEMVSAIWSEPSKIIEKSAKSEVSLPPPQFYELMRIRLVNAKKPENFCQFTNTQRLTPQLFKVQGALDLFVNVMPGDHLYDVSNPDFTPTRLGTREALLPPYPDNALLPIHRLVIHSNPPNLLYHKHELYVKNFEKLTQKLHLFHINAKKQ